MEFAATYILHHNPGVFAARTRQESGEIVRILEIIPAHQELFEENVQIIPFYHQLFCALDSVDSYRRTARNSNTKLTDRMASESD